MAEGWGNKEGSKPQKKWKERHGGGLHLWCCHATVTRAAVIGLHIEGFCGAAGWANSQLDLSDGIQSSSLPSLLCSSLFSTLPWRVHFFLFLSSLWPLFTHLYRLCLIPLANFTLTVPFFLNHTFVTSTHIHSQHINLKKKIITFSSSAFSH